MYFVLLGFSTFLLDIFCVCVSVSLFLPCPSFTFNLGFPFLESTFSTKGLSLSSHVSAVYLPFLPENTHARVKFLLDMNKPELVLQQTMCLSPESQTKSPTALGNWFKPGNQL